MGDLLAVWRIGTLAYIAMALLAFGASLGLAEEPILTTSYDNPPYNSSSPTWASDVSRSQRFFVNAFPPYEWMQILDPTSEADDDIVGILGVAIMPGLSGNDLPFTHPFGFDWEFFVAADPQYWSLMGPSNTGMGPSNTETDHEYAGATQHATSMGLSVPKGVLGVETDQDIVPPVYRAIEGDRVAVFGRWVVDCGHTDFHTEIHPPLLLVTARPGGGAVDRNRAFPPSEATSSFLISRPWLVGQRFEVDDEAIRQHLINEVEKVETFRSLRVEAHPKISKPFSGIHLFGYTLRPPSPRVHPDDRLMVNFHFTVRHGVVVQVYKAGPDAVGVLISMNADSYRMASLPRKNDWDIPLSFINRYTDLVSDVLLADAIGHPLAAILLSRDWLTDRYDAPEASSVHDSEITRIVVDDLRGNTPFSVDDGQPFPIYGEILLEWQHPVPAESRIVPNLGTVRGDNPPALKDAVRQTLESVGLRLGRVSGPGPRHIGTLIVIGQAPEAGLSVPRETPVDITIDYIPR
jgi:hypothetical protein